MGNLISRQLADRIASNRGMRADSRHNPNVRSGGIGYVKIASERILSDAQARAKDAGRKHFVLSDFMD